MSARDRRPEVKIWDVQTGEELLSLKGHIILVRSVAFSPDGKRLATGEGEGSDVAIKVWDLQSGQELLTLTGGRIAVFSPDGNRLAAYNPEDGAVKIYDATPVPEKP